MIATLPIIRNFLSPTNAVINQQTAPLLNNGTIDSEIKISNLNVSIGNNHI